MPTGQPRSRYQHSDCVPVALARKTPRFLAFCRMDLGLPAPFPPPLFRGMRRGLSLPELLLVLTIVGTLLGVGLPRLGAWLDWAAVDAAAGEATMAIAVARHKAIAGGTRTQLVIRADVLTIDTLGPPGWSRWRDYPGPAARGVALAVSNARIAFAPNGIAWGASNTRIVLRRGSRSETITVSRVGRVKRW